MDNLESHVVALEWILPNIQFASKVSVVSPDAGGVYRAKKFQDAMMKHYVGTSDGKWFQRCWTDRCGILRKTGGGGGSLEMNHTDREVEGSGRRESHWLEF